MIEFLNELKNEIKSLYLMYHKKKPAIKYYIYINFSDFDKEKKRIEKEFCVIIQLYTFKNIIF